MIEPLFLGLKVMSDKKIVHNDIKYNNIVLHKGVFKYIDFGLANSVSKKQHFQQRSLDELNTSRIYLFYPLEYLLFYASNHKLHEELNNVIDGYFRNNTEQLNQVNMLFGTDIINEYQIVIDSLKNKSISETKMIQGIDTYSLGILIPLLFLYHTKLGETQNPFQLFLKQILMKDTMVQDFFSLFAEQTTPLSPSFKIRFLNLALLPSSLVKRLMLES